MENERREFLKALDFGSQTGEFHKSLADAIERVSQAHSKLNDVVILKPRSNGPTERLNFHIMGMGAHMPSIFHDQIEASMIRHGMQMDPVIIVDEIGEFTEDHYEYIKKIISEKELYHPNGGYPWISQPRVMEIHSLTEMCREAAARCDEIRDFDPPKNFLFTEPPRQKKSRNRPDKITIARMNKRKKKR